MVSVCSTAQHMIWLCDTPVDWSATGDFWSGAGTLLGVGAVVWAAKKGAATFEQWRQQKLAERHIDQAERILTAVDNAKDALASVRSIFMWPHEGDEARRVLEADERWGRHGEREQRILVKAQAYYHRLHRTRDKQDALNACRPMARAFFGDEIEAAIARLHQQFWIVQTYVDAFRTDQGADEDFSRKIRDAMYDNARDPDNEISGVARECIQTIENELLPILRNEQSAPPVRRKWLTRS